MDNDQGLGALLLGVELAGIFVFAISGALLAVVRQFDIFGVVVLAAATGLGGGVIRDVLIGAVPPAALGDWRYLVTPLAAALVTFRFHPALGRGEGVINVFDAAGLGLFCVTGASKALDYGLQPVPAALLGMVTGVGGGMIRDLLADRVPVILRAGELYAIPALAGATVVVASRLAELSPFLTALLGVVVCTGWRLVASQRGWRAPSPGPPH